MGWFNKKKKQREEDAEPLKAVVLESTSQSSPQQRHTLLISTLDDISGEGLTSVTWFELDKIENIRDFDDVILDFWDFPEIKGKQFPPYSDSDISVWKKYDSLFTDQITYEYLCQGGRIAVVGDPDFMRPGRGFHGSSQPSNVWFTPSIAYSSMEWERAKGRKFTITSGGESCGMLAYFKRMSEYSTAFHEFSAHFEPNGNDFWDVKPLVTTPVGKPVSFGIIHRRIPTSSGQEIGHFIFFPAVAASHEDAILLLLAEFSGVQATLDTAVPAWAAGIQIVGEDQIDVEQAELQLQLEDIDKKLRALQERRMEVRKPAELLFATADTFERAVRNAFRELGALVQDSEDPSKEDGWLAISVGGDLLTGVLEMKGVAKATFDTQGLRQLGNWVQRGKNKGIDYKPIFVGVSSRNSVPSRREDPFSADFRNTAKEFGVAVLTGEVLFQVVMLDRQGKLDREKFWSELFDCVGVFSM